MNDIDSGERARRAAQEPPTDSQSGQDGLDEQQPRAPRPRQRQPGASRQPGQQRPRQPGRPGQTPGGRETQRQRPAGTAGRGRQTPAGGPFRQRPEQRYRSRCRRCGREIWLVRGQESYGSLCETCRP